MIYFGVSKFEGGSPLITVIVLTIFVITYALIMQGKYPRSVVAFAAGIIILLLKISPELTVESVGEYVDFNTIGLLLGMMIIVGVLKSTGFFEYVTAWIVKISKGRMLRITLLMLIAGALLSSILDNVTTILVFAPIVFLIADSIQINPTPLILALLFSANIGGTATILGDPPNLLIGSAANAGFIQFSSVMLWPTLIVLAVFILYFRRKNAYIAKIPSEKLERLLSIDPSKAITNVKLFKQSLVVFVFVILGFLLHSVLGYEPSLIALSGAIAILILGKGNFQTISLEIEWETIFFFIGLFALTRALKDVGVTGAVATAISQMQVSPIFIVLTVLWVSGLLSGIIGAVPITTVFIPIVQSLQGTIPNSYELWWALALGASLGGNTSFSGAAANMVAVGLVEKNYKDKVKYGAFLREGIVVSLIGLTVGTAYLAIRWFML